MIASANTRTGVERVQCAKGVEARSWGGTGRPHFLPYPSYGTTAPGGSRETGTRRGGTTMSLLDTLFGGRKTEMIASDQALPGSDAPRFAIPANHAVLGTPIQGPFPNNLEVAFFGLG